LQKCTDKKVINRILDKICDSHESYWYWDMTTHNYSDQWLSCIDNRILVAQENGGFWKEEIECNPSEYLILPDNMVRGLSERFGDSVRVIGNYDAFKNGKGFKEIKQLTQRQQLMLNDANAFLKAAEYEIKYPIKVVDFEKKNRLGLALKETIYISTKAFEMGRHEVVAVLIEEQEHLVTNFADETREFQNHFIKKFINLLEEKTNNYL
jgi:hypothetical protein